MSKDIFRDSLIYHAKHPAGKLAVVPTKPLDNRRDLALAYSPGVGGPCLEIAKDPSKAADLTARANLIGVITDGTAVLGLGNIGPLASKPVMEGKAVLFKKFAGIDAFDIEINEKDPDKLVDIIASLEPTFGGINLEDIKAPECFYIEEKLKERLKIPVFHDDQHGTAITVGAAILNGIDLLEKKIDEVRLVTSGAGAAAIACIELLIGLGLKRENVTLTDSKGVVFLGRKDLENDPKKNYAKQTSARSLADAMVGADIFLGLSVANTVTVEMVASMAKKPLILALANPDPEISPTLVTSVVKDAIVATGRSDFPNQVNNAICFPYIFRGALDVGATTINQEMKIACVKAIAKLAQAESSDIVSNAYGGEIHRFGPEFIIPKPFDPRLLTELASVVAETAMQTGVATRPIADMAAYREKLQAFIYGSSLVMRPIFAAAKHRQSRPIRVAFAEGEEERVLQAVQTLVDEGIGYPILIGRPEVIERRIHKLALRIKPDVHFSIVDPNNDVRYHQYWTAYHNLTERRGVSRDFAKTLVRTNNTIIAALMVHLGDADTLLCGTISRYIDNFIHLQQVLGVQPQYNLGASLCAIVKDHQPLFLCDPYVNVDPTAAELVDMTLMSAQQIRRFGITPNVALVSHSNFGSSRSASARKMQTVLRELKARAPELEVEGEMHADAALCPEVRGKIFPNSTSKGAANLLIMPNIEAAHISFKMAQALGNDLIIGPILMGIRGSAQILSPTTDVRGIIDMTALAVVDALELLKTQGVLV